MNIFFPVKSPLHVLLSLFWALLAIPVTLPAADDPFTGDDPEDSAFTESDRAVKSGISTGFSDQASAISRSGVPDRFFRDRRGVDTPIVDDMGKVIYKSLAEKSPSEMTEEDFYKTLTPAEKVLLSKQPVTGPELIETAVRISRVGRPEFAKILAEKSLSADGDPADYAAVINRLGEDKLISFAHIPALNEVAGPAITKTMEEAKKAWSSPEWIEDAFKRTSSLSSETREAALADLKRGYPESFDFLLEKLDSDDETERQQAESVLAAGGIFAAEGLLARARCCAEPDLARITGILAKNGSLPEITPLLVRYYDESTGNQARTLLENVIRGQLGSVPTRAEGAARAYERGMAYFEKKIVLPNVVGGEYPVWVQNDGCETVRRMVPTETALRMLAAQTLRDAYTLSPESSEIRAAAEVAAAEEILYRNGLDAPVDTKEFTDLFPNLAESDYADALHLALETGHEKGGIIPAVLLGATHDTELCVGDGPTDLVRAALSRDRRLRFTALKAIAEIAPTASYPGSSGVTASLIWFSTSAGKRRAIVASPDLNQIGTIGNYIADGGVLTTPAGTGRDILTKAQSDADVEFVVALSDIKTPDLRTVAQALAADYRTADVPILIASEDDTRLEQARRAGEGEPNALVAILPFDTDSGKKLVQELYVKTDPRQVPAEVRLEQAKEAVRILCQFRKTSPNIYQLEDLEDLALRFLVTPHLTDEGLDFAMTVPAKSVQITLSQLTFDHRFELEAREKFLAGLEKHIGEYGLLLRGPDILRLFSGPWPGDSGEIRKTFFRLLRDNTPEKSELALSIPSSHVQNLLGDLVGDSSADQAERETCLDLFRRHLAKYGLLLERDDVKRLYDRYNATESESKLDQDLTAAVLDAIETWQAGHLGIE